MRLGNDVMLPPLEWESKDEPNPTCASYCGGKRNGSSFDIESGYWVCGRCRKPGPGNLRECPLCCEVWLPAEPTEPEVRKELMHDLCALELETL